MVSGIVVAPVVWAVHVSSTIVHRRVSGAFRVRFGLILVYREITGVFGFFCADAAVCIFSLGELMI